MLGALLMIFTTYIWAKIRNFEINEKILTLKSTVIILIVTATVIFWLFHIFISKDKTFSRYEDNWEEGNIRIIRGITTIMESLLYMCMVMNIEENRTLFQYTRVLVVLIIIMNVVQVILINNEYSTNIRELIVDSILMQIQDTRNALFIVLAVLCAKSWTIFGCIIILIFSGIFIGILC